MEPDRITLSLEIEVDSNRGKNDRNHDSNDRDRDRVLTENEAQVLAILRREPSINAVQVAAEMKVSVSTVNRVYKSLKRKSYIARDNQARDERIILK